MARMPRIERKVEYKDIAASEMQATGEGIVTGYLSTWHNIDEGNDRVIPGAFTRTIKDAKARRSAHQLDYLFPALWNHSWESLPVGGVTDAREDEHGLKVQIRMNLDTQLGRECYASLRHGTLSAMSMGYRAIIYDYERIENKQVRNLRECALMESTFCIFPMNTRALVTSVKQAWQGFSAKGNTMFMRTKDFDARYLAQNLDDWQYADWNDLATALHQAVLDLFAPGGDPLADLETEVISQLAAALRAYVQAGVDLGYEPGGMQDSYGMMSAGASYDLKEGRMISQANHVKISAATDGIMKHVKVIKSVLDEAARSRALQGYPRATASISSIFESKEEEDEALALMGTLATSLEVDNMLREGREHALTPGDLGLDPASRVDAALAALKNSQRKR